VAAEDIHSPHTERIGISWGWGFYGTKKIKKCMKLNRNFQGGGEVLEIFPL